MEADLFDLKKIKEITSPVEDLEGKIESIIIRYEDISTLQQSAKKEIDDAELVSQLEKINTNLRDLTETLRKKSEQNLSSLLFFQDKLIEKYKQGFLDQLKNLGLTSERTKKIGLNLINEKKISKIIEGVSYIPSITLSQWLELIESLKENSIFLSPMEKLRLFYDDILEKRLEKELELIPKGTDPILIEDYKKNYKQNQITFEQYLENIEKSLSEKELQKKKEIIETTKKQQKLAKLKKKQKQQQQSYKDYITLSEKEFQRKLRKGKRESLTNISDGTNQKREISEEVSEKIQKFKDQFENRFNDDIFIKKDDGKDPLDIIRERRKKKREEYKTHYKKLKDND